MIDRSGFTLIELAVTMAVIGIVGAIAVPSMVPPKREQSAASVAEGALREAAQRAAISGELVEMLVEPARGRIEVRAHGSEPARTIQFAPATGAAVRFTFSGTGRSTGGPLRITQDQRSTLISVDPWTGRASRRME